MDPGACEVELRSGDVVWIRQVRSTDDRLGTGALGEPQVVLDQRVLGAVRAADHAAPAAQAARAVRLLVLDRFGGVVAPPLMLQTWTMDATATDGRQAALQAETLLALLATRN